MATDVSEGADAVAGIITATSHLPSLTVGAVVLLGAFWTIAYRSRMAKRDVMEAQGAAMVRIVEGFIAEGYKSNAANQDAMTLLSTAIVDLRIASAGQVALLGNLTQAVAALGADVAQSNTRCLTCKTHKADYEHGNAEG